jgi:uncharacterized damage-inducible protein DinB
MHFSLPKSIEILQRTPDVLMQLLDNISPDWAAAKEGEGTWSAYDIIGHLIHGEKTDWIPRMEIILSGKEDKRFELFDRFAQFENSKGKTLMELLNEFKSLRENNIEVLRSKNLTGKEMKATGIHPAFGSITLSQLLATWTVHDLNHIAQISRVMAKYYTEDVGPWVPYLKILQ